MTQCDDNRLKIFSDLSLLDYGEYPVTMLYPFFTRDNYNSTLSIPNQYIKYSELSENIFNFCPLEESDIAIFPIPWEHVVINK
jgi:hypothetical protein